jgi:ribulose-phosphate 3-epimerase
MIREGDMKAGLALNPDTPLFSIAHVMGSIDLLLIMTVNPGFAGQGFMGEVLAKVRKAHMLKEAEGYDYILCVDGGVTQANIGEIVDAGADMVVAGSAVFGTDDNIPGAVRALKGNSSDQ